MDNGSTESGPPTLSLLAQNYGVCSYDITNNLTISSIYQLPFGRGRTFLKDSNGFVNGLVGGWELAGIPYRAGYVQTGGGFLLDRCLPWQAEQPAIDRWEHQRQIVHRERVGLDARLVHRREQLDDLFCGTVHIRRAALDVRGAIAAVLRRITDP